MNTFESHTIDESWHTLVENVIVKGDIVSPRGKKTKELENVVLFYPHVDQYKFINMKRRINPVFHLVELFYFLNGRNDDLLSNYIQTMSEFENSTHRFDGSYGPSIYESLPFVIRELSEDHDTRRAVVPILRSHHLNGSSKDIPCNVFLQFRERNGELNMTTVTRSQDLFRGFLYDTLEFQLLHYILAWLLKLEPGNYTHYMGSLHLYDTDASAALESLAEPINAGSIVRPILPDWDSPSDFWRYSRRVMDVAEFLSNPSDDIQRAIRDWRMRVISRDGLGFYESWVKWWLDTRKDSGSS